MIASCRYKHLLPKAFLATLWRGAPLFLLMVVIIIYELLLFFPSNVDRYIGSGSSNIFFLFGSLIVTVTMIILFLLNRLGIASSLLLSTVISGLSVIALLFLGPQTTEEVWLRIIAAERGILHQDHGTEAKIVFDEGYFDVRMAILVYVSKDSNKDRKNASTDLVIRKL